MPLVSYRASAEPVLHEIREVSQAIDSPPNSFLVFN